MVEIAGGELRRERATLKCRAFGTGFSGQISMNAIVPKKCAPIRLVKLMPNAGQCRAFVQPEGAAAIPYKTREGAIRE